MEPLPCFSFSSSSSTDLSLPPCQLQTFKKLNMSVCVCVCVWVSKMTLFLFEPKKRKRVGEVRRWASAATFCKYGMLLHDNEWHTLNMPLGLDWMEEMGAMPLGMAWDAMGCLLGCIGFGLVLGGLTGWLFDLVLLMLQRRMAGCITGLHSKSMLNAASSAPCPLTYVAAYVNVCYQVEMVLMLLWFYCCCCCIQIVLNQNFHKQAVTTTLSSSRGLSLAQSSFLRKLRRPSDNEDGHGVHDDDGSSGGGNIIKMINDLHYHIHYLT